MSRQIKVDEKATEDAQFRMEYKAKLDESMRRIRALDNNLIKSYALLWERCAKAMQNKIQARSDYQSIIFNNPIKLLEAIKQHALNFDEIQYAMSIIANSVRAFFTTVHKDNESLTEYTRRFMTS